MKEQFPEREQTPKTKDTTLLVTEALERRRVSGAAIIIVALEAARRRGLEEVKEDLLETYIFLLEGLGVAPASYSFHFEPLPTSRDLNDHLGHLVEAGYLAGGFDRPFSITEEGQKKVQEMLGIDCAIVLSGIGGRIRQWSEMNKGELFELAAETSRF